MDLYTIEVFTLYIGIVIILVLSLLYHTYVVDAPVQLAEVKALIKGKTYRDYIDTAHSGLIRGLVFGIILGDLGIVSGIRNAAIYGTINPLFLYMGY